MYCKNCGKELGNDVRFCPNCGTFVQEDAQQPSTATAPIETNAGVVENKPPKVWTVFSIIGKILGIVCISTSLIPYLNWFSFGFGIIGIVMSCLGKKAKTEETDRNSRIGLILSIVAVAVSLVMIIVYAVLFGLLLESALWYY